MLKTHNSKKKTNSNLQKRTPQKCIIKMHTSGQNEKQFTNIYMYAEVQINYVAYDENVKQLYLTKC